MTKDLLMGLLPIAAGCLLMGLLGHGHLTAGVRSILTEIWFWGD